MLRALIIGFASLLPAVAGADAQKVRVTQAWARATPPGMTMGVVYLTLESQQDDQLIGATTPVAATVEIHESLMSNSVMTMRPLAAVALSKGRSVKFEPAGKHFMLVGLRKTLSAGDSFPFTLKLAKAGTFPVTVNVRKDE